MGAKQNMFCGIPKEKLPASDRKGSDGTFQVNDKGIFSWVRIPKGTAMRLLFLLDFIF